MKNLSIKLSGIMLYFFMSCGLSVSPRMATEVNYTSQNNLESRSIGVQTNNLNDGFEFNGIGELKRINKDSTEVKILNFNAGIKLDPKNEEPSKATSNKKTESNK